MAGGLHALNAPRMLMPTALQEENLLYVVYYLLGLQ